MKPQFHEDYVNDRADPLSDKCCDFDWKEVDACLEEIKDEETQVQVRLAVALRRVFTWVLNNNNNNNINRGTLQHFGRRTVAFAWVMNPELFDGKSLTNLADSLGLDKQTLSKLSAAVTKRFGIQNRGQAHGWNRKAKGSPYASSGPRRSRNKSDQANTPPRKHDGL